MTEEQYATKQAKAGRGNQAVAREAGSTPAAPTKYRNRPTGGYSSAKEARRAVELKTLQQAGVIVAGTLREQVPFIIIPAQRNSMDTLLERQCRYVADFVYRLKGHDADTIEDCKGMRTPDYIIKRKLMLHVHGIAIRET